MTKRFLILILGVALLAAASVQAQSQGGDKAASLDQLLKMVEQGRVGEQREAQQREQQFAQAKSEQQNLLNQAKARKGQLESRSSSLETSFQANEVKIAELTEARNQRLGSLKELFGVLTQVAGDTSGLFQNSIISAQFPDRTPFLVELAGKMGTGTKLASIEEIERLWFELQREATESSKVARFTGAVEGSSGTEDRTIVRVGAFNLVSDGKYLKYEPTTGKVQDLPRQPPQGRFVDTTDEIVNAPEGSGFHTFALDPTRGQILSLLLQVPSLTDRIHQGGIVGYLILVLGAFGLLIAIWRFFVLAIESSKVSAQLKSDQPSDNNALGRLLLAYEKNKNVDTETLELKMGEAVLKEVPRIEAWVTVLKIIAVVAPLMGLLGTVTGMIQTFQVITLFGTGDPKLMAGGISQALVTTVEGLCVAIPMVLLHTFVSTRAQRIVHILEEQATGLIAERSERGA
jgi:biopolymer transport protein ExbB